MRRELNELEDASQSDADTIAALKASLEAKDEFLQQMKALNEKQIAAMNMSHDAALAAAKSVLSDMETRVRKLEEVNEEEAKKFVELTASLETKEEYLKQMADLHAAEVGSLTTSHKSALAAAMATLNNAQEMQQAEASMAGKLAAARKEAEGAFTAELAAKDAAHREQIIQLEAALAAKVKHAEEMEAMHKNGLAEMKVLNDSVKAGLSQQDDELLASIAGKEDGMQEMVRLHANGKNVISGL